MFGIQGDTSTGVNADATAPTLTTTAVNNDTKWIATLTARVGFAWDRMLWYAKGGAAWVRNEYTALDPAFGITATGTTTRTGYVIGGGWEYAITPEWSGFIEYDYIGLSDSTVTLMDPVFGPGPMNANQDIQIVKVGFNFKLPAPHW